jgi:hypothetical protein
MEVSSFKVFNNVSRREGKIEFLQKNDFFGKLVYCEGVDNIRNYVKMDSYHATFGPP